MPKDKKQAKEKKKESKVEKKAVKKSSFVPPSGTTADKVRKEILPELPVEEKTDSAKASSDKKKVQPELTNPNPSPVESSSAKATADNGEMVGLMPKAGMGQTRSLYGLIQAQPIVEEMSRSYLDYAMSVIVQRALPDVRDGLKPVHRRILYAMWSIGLRSSAKFRKSATVVGEVLGKYHPHGDSAVYESMVRMAQNFSMRYPLIKGQGNFGSMDGDGAAAMRYTEAKLAAISEELLFDLEKETVGFIPNFDGSHQEPQVLPAKLPNLLLNGTMGIAVGMSTEIPPHNLRELTGAINCLIANPEATVEDLCKFVKGPDFPTGGIIYNQKDIETVYGTGKGGIVMRGVAEIVESKGDKFQIIISEIPYQVNKATLVEKIAELVTEKKIEGIRDLRDESDREKSVRIVVDLKKDAYPKKVLNALFKMTALQSTFHVNMLALVDGIQPKVLNLKSILEEYIKHREDVVRKRTQYDLDKAKDRAHVLEGLVIALENIDAIIKVIKASKDKDDAKVNLIKKFRLTERQAIAILEMKLQQLANLERLRVEEELKEKMKLIAELESILKSRTKILNIVKTELGELTEKFGDERRTQVVARGVKDFSIEDLVPNEETMVMMTRDGYIKRLPPDTFKQQERGGKGVIGLSTKEEDTVEFMFTTMTHTDLLMFTTRGRVFQLKAHEVPVASRTAKGTPIVNFLQLLGEERITSTLPLDKIVGAEYLFFATEKGLVKKVKLEAFANVRRSGLIAIKIKGDDKLIWAKPTCGSDEIQLITSEGQAIRFAEDDVREMGRNAAGVRGIRLKGKDVVVGMGIISTDKERIKKYQVLNIMANGFGKRSPLDLYKVQGRGGSGIRTSHVTDKTGKLTNAFVVNAETMAEKDLVIISEKGQVIRLPFKQVNELGRDTQGVRVMRFKEEGDKVACVTWA
jgi:DNA gyrase subunit A